MIKNIVTIVVLLIPFCHSQYPNYYGNNPYNGRYGGGTYGGAGGSPSYYRQPPSSRQQPIEDSTAPDIGDTAKPAVNDQASADQMSYRSPYQVSPSADSNNYDAGIYPDYDTAAAQQLPPQWQQQQQFQQQPPQRQSYGQQRLTTSTTTKEPELEPLSPLMVQMLNNIIGKNQNSGASSGAGVGSSDNNRVSQPYRGSQYQRQPQFASPPDQDPDQMAATAGDQQGPMMGYEGQGMSPFFMQRPGMRPSFQQQASPMFMTQQQQPQFGQPMRQRPAFPSMQQQQQALQQPPPPPVQQPSVQQPSLPARTAGPSPAAPMTTPALTLAEPPQRANGVLLPGIKPSLPFVNWDTGSAALFPLSYAAPPVGGEQGTINGFQPQAPHVPADALGLVTWE